VWGGAAHSGIIIFDERAAGEHGSKSGGTKGGAAAPHMRGRVVCGSEVEAIGQLQHLVEGVDPDVVCGFDIQRGSIGYILDRCAHIRSEKKRFELWFAL
jgi:DNA polymerase elongation subunit (family B)